MQGWKTKLAGIAGILTGVGMAISGLVNGEFDSVKEGVMLIIASLATIGIGHKVDKLTDASSK